MSVNDFINMVVKAIEDYQNKYGVEPTVCYIPDVLWDSLIDGAQTYATHDMGTNFYLTSCLLKKESFQLYGIQCVYSPHIYKLDFNNPYPEVLKY